jgi:hypothetical protein
MTFGKIISCVLFHDIVCIQNAQRRMVGWLMNDESEEILNEGVVGLS